MSSLSPTVEGFRAAFRQPLLALGEITWRWVVGATATALFFYGLFEYLNTLPVSSSELFFLRSRQPYLVAQAIAHILRGNLSRGLLSLLLAGLLIALLYTISASVGRIAVLRAMLEYFRERLTSAMVGAGLVTGERPAEVYTSTSSVASRGSYIPLFRLNFLRISLALAAVLGFLGAEILAGFASPDSNPRPGVAFLLFLPMAGLITLIWWAFNWLLSLAGLFAVRDGEDAIGSIAAAVTLCRQRTGAVLAVSTWTGLAHLVAFVGATTIVSMPLGFMPLVPWRLVVLAMIVVTLLYFALADWLYTARLAGYVCIAEMPEALLRPPVPPRPIAVPPSQGALPSLVQTTIDKNELILSDVPLSAPQTTIDRDEVILSDVPGSPEH